jgi:putative transposase
MKKSKFSDQQIAFALNQAEAGTSVEEVCRKMGISQATFFRWKKVYGGLMPSEVRRLKQLEEESGRLRLVADLTLDKEMLTEVKKKRSDAGAGQRDDRPREDGVPGFDPPGLPGGSGAALDVSLHLGAAAAGYPAPGSTRAASSHRRSWTSGPTPTESCSTSAAPAGPPTTHTLRASTPWSGSNASASTGSWTSTTRGKRWRIGGRSTTK